MIYSNKKWFAIHRSSVLYQLFKELILNNDITTCETKEYAKKSFLNLGVIKRLYNHFLAKSNH